MIGRGAADPAAEMSVGATAAHASAVASTSIRNP